MTLNSQVRGRILGSVGGLFGLALVYYGFAGGTPVPTGLPDRLLGEQQTTCWAINPKYPCPKINVVCSGIQCTGFPPSCPSTAFEYQNLNVTFANCVQVKTGKFCDQSSPPVTTCINRRACDPGSLCAPDPTQGNKRFCSSTTAAFTAYISYNTLALTTKCP
jgi:hypothetical protein